ncbi:MFS transporter [Thermococcus stetteri]|uniref:hypothetical protein n=1 Tax=Thermococcus stetteri TaxID=49900 RepID=UPI001AEA30F5|nr:hypothetical protein [Thermococcus stetteri]MBP1910790.1 ABC-type uncharacterized transport system permease subunit [Thermococcus stetteri]
MEPGELSAQAAVIEVFNGVANSMFNISLQTLFQKTVPSNLLGRVLSLDYFITSAFLLISIGVGGVLADKIGVSTMLLIAGILEIITVLIAFWVIEYLGRDQ